ncbi:uncharacterized protein N7515_009789 [Penicillium bovifimosum]|uniref:3'-5' exonuclease domain-containing protein n=1 Tax=Penicillium bovifimosum TaxID=126998 RepID=A0A9W9GHL5_9EURO|nr:uncharacterized protein N7515_009789 [Penicillium bovifimosum]KAJ5120401.1 hypothetical protein N7515_009789 [Penicillium bovifimosum]
MPSRPHLLACRKIRFPITSNSGTSITYKAQRTDASEWCGAHSCTRFSPQLRCASSPRAISSYSRPSVAQSKRHFSNTTRKDGSIWDEDDDELPEPPPARRTPSRPIRARPTVHKDVSDLVRARVDGSARRSQRKDIEKQFNLLVSYQVMVGSFIQLKYQHLDDKLSELIDVNKGLQAEWKSLSVTFQKRISDAMSRITKKVLQAERTTHGYVDEWAMLSTRIESRYIEMIADTRDQVLQAEKTTQKYAQEVTRLSSSILGLNRIQAAVTESEEVCRLIDHDFCRTVFYMIPEWKSKLKRFDQNIRQWRKPVRAARIKHLSEQVHCSERSISRLRETLNNEYRARKAARDRIDRVLAQGDLVHKTYSQLKASHQRITFSTICRLCGELSRSENIRPLDQHRFLEFASVIADGRNVLHSRLHAYRSNWLQNQWDAHPLRQSQAWDLRGITNAIAREVGDLGSHNVMNQIALASPNKIGFIRRNTLQLSHSLYSVYRPIWKQRPARSPELPIYWRQLDVLGPFQIVNFASWRIGEEAMYLLNTLKGRGGDLWSWVPSTTLTHTMDKLHQWCATDHDHRSEFRREFTNYRHLNWLRLRSETTLHSMGEPVYLAGKFEVRNPLSQDARRFGEWTRTMGELITDGYVAQLAMITTPEQWNEIYRKLELLATTKSRVENLGSSKAWRKRKKGRREPGSPGVAPVSQPSRGSAEVTSRRPWGLPPPPLESSPEQPADTASMLPKLGARERSSTLATNNGSQEESHLQHKPSTTAWKKARKFANGHQPESNFFSGNPTTNQDGHGHSRTVFTPRAAPWATTRRFSNEHHPESSPSPIKPTGQKYKPLASQADSINPHGVAQQVQRVLSPTVTRYRDQSDSLGAASKKKELAEQAFDFLFAKGPPHTIPKVSSGYRRRLGRIRNKSHVAATRLRKHSLTPGGNVTREYSTSVSVYETKSQSESANDDSLRERPLEHDMSSFSNAENGHRRGFSEANFPPDEAVPPAEIEPNADNLTMPQFWTHSSQQSPNGQKPIVHYCRTLQSTEQTMQHFLESKVIGFDLEWKAQASGSDSVQSNVSLIQIANEERIALFQVALFKPARSLEDLVSPSLKRLIESPDVIKVGVAIKADCTRLRKYLGIDARATFELSHLFKLVKYGRDNPKLVNKRGVNLSDQMREHFGLPLEKSDDVRCGDWSRALNYRQVQYAATDPYACLRLFHIMEAKRLAIDPTPPRPAYAELNQPIILPLGQKVIEDEKEPLI